MTSPHDFALPLQAALLEYFAGERREMLLVLGGSALFVTLAVWLWIADRSAFATGFTVTVLISVALVASTAGSLLVRDKSLVGTLTQQVNSPDARAAIQAERGRVEVVASKYRYYRYGAATITALVLLGLLLSHRPWVHGVAAGLLLLVVAQVMIDHYSERRAGLYLERLTQSANAPNP
ncbi:hypothetical protein B0E47_11300 [Rhodanobacter sp. B05]|uniref:hypothetical protein n=1 Tax=Rhodanobacter sp. B05 TaxID=1945859 RepID=UPI0009850129|nr:hypothetical protein [Rhodanobacter sp. B05]OOG54652.1 hypothetical protein B0E47_11300 [Rhodanobacter sp. B05]